MSQSTAYDEAEGAAEVAAAFAAAAAADAVAATTTAAAAAAARRHSAAVTTALISRPRAGPPRYRGVRIPFAGQDTAGRATETILSEVGPVLLRLFDTREARCA